MMSRLPQPFTTGQDPSSQMMNRAGMGDVPVPFGREAQNQEAIQQLLMAFGPGLMSMGANGLRAGAGAATQGLSGRAGEIFNPLLPNNLPNDEVVALLRQSGGSLPAEALRNTGLDPFFAAGGERVPPGLRPPGGGGAGGGGGGRNLGGLSDPLLQNKPVFGQRPPPIGSGLPPNYAELPTQAGPEALADTASMRAPAGAGFALKEALPPLAAVSGAGMLAGAMLTPPEKGTKSPGATREPMPPQWFDAAAALSSSMPIGAAEPGSPFRQGSNPASPYKIKQGDTLSGIAMGMLGPQADHASVMRMVQSIAGSNGIADPNKIQAGASLNLPGGGPPPQTPIDMANRDPTFRSVTSPDMADPLIGDPVYPGRRPQQTPFQSYGYDR